MQDRAMPAWSRLALDPIAATTADPHSSGFRKARRGADAREPGATVLSHSPRSPWRLAGDIQSGFDTISPAGLRTPRPLDTAILSTGLNAGSRATSVLDETEEGTPQGGIRSPVLATRTLDGLETLRLKQYPHAGVRARTGKHTPGNVVRDAEDFVMTGLSQEVREKAVKPLVVACLHPRGLARSAEQTRRTPMEDGGDFLGQHARTYHGHCLTRPSKKNVKTWLARIRNVIKDNTQATADGLIAIRNPTIRGWANFHRQAAAQAPLVHVETAICQARWRWARRRHPKQGRRWAANRYCGRVGNEHWRFCGTAKDHKGNTIQHGLCRASATPVTRDITIQGACNPYDPAWDISRAERLGVKREKTLRGTRTLAHLWKEPGGHCPVCPQPITPVTGWHTHHIVYKTMGGTDGMRHRMLIHPNGHRHVHAKGRTVSKPRPVKAAPHRQPGALFQA